MEWNQSETIGLAKVSCSYCKGIGMRPGRNEEMQPCHCVFRAIFRACYARFRECAAAGAQATRVSLERCRGKEGRHTYCRMVEEYMADFCLLSKRTLNEEEYRLFRYHFLLGAGWRLCCRFLNLDRGNFFHTVYRIEQKLGRAFRETEPYGLYPVDEYFGGRNTRNRPAKIAVMPPRREETSRRNFRKTA